MAATDTDSAVGGSWEDQLEAARDGIPGQQDFDGGEVNGTPVEGLSVAGTVQLGLLDFGGKQPTSASLKLKVAAIDVDGAYRKGDIVRFSGVAVVRSMTPKDKVDKKTGIVVECVQEHVAEITDLSVEGVE